MNPTIEKAIAAGLIKKAEQLPQKHTVLTDYQPGAYITTQEAATILQRANPHRHLKNHGLPSFTAPGSRALLWNRKSVERLAKKLLSSQLPAGNWYTAAQAAQMLNCSTEQVTRWGIAGRMRFVSILDRTRSSQTNLARKKKLYAAEDVEKLAKIGARFRKPKRKK